MDGATECSAARPHPTSVLNRILWACVRDPAPDISGVAWFSSGGVLKNHLPSDAMTVADEVEWRQVDQVRSPVSGPRSQASLDVPSGREHFASRSLSARLRSASASAMADTRAVPAGRWRAAHNIAAQHLSTRIEKLSNLTSLYWTDCRVRSCASDIGVVPSSPRRFYGPLSFGELKAELTEKLCL